MKQRNTYEKLHVYIVIIKYMYGCYALTNVSMYDHDASLNTSPFIRHILQSATQECTFLTHMGVFQPDTLYMHTVLMNHVPSLQALPESEHMTSYVESFCPFNLSHASVHECATIATYYKRNITCFRPFELFSYYFSQFSYIQTIMLQLKTK